MSGAAPKRPAPARVAHDPIFAVIDEHSAALEALDDCLEVREALETATLKAGRGMILLERQRSSAARYFLAIELDAQTAFDQAERRLLRTPPRTTSGLLALIRYLEKVENAHLLDADTLPDLLASIAAGLSHITGCEARATKGGAS